MTARPMPSLRAPKLPYKKTAYNSFVILPFQSITLSIVAMNQLEQLKQFTTVVADTGDFQAIKAFAPRDATTNPSLILKAVQKDEYRPLLERAVRDHAARGMVHIVDQLLVAFGLEILQIIPGR